MNREVFQIEDRNFLILTLMLFCLGCIAGVDDPYWSDEVETIDIIDTSSLAGVIENVSQSPHTPIYFVLLWGVTSIFQSINPLITRSFGVLLGLLSIVIMYLFGLHFYRRSIARVSSLLIALSNTFVHYSLNVRPYALLLFLSVLSSYFYKLLLETDNRTSLIGYTVANISLLYTHVFSSFLLMSHFLDYLYVSYNEHKSFGQYLKGMSSICVSYSTTLVLFLPWSFLLLEQEKAFAGSFIRPLTTYTFFDGVTLLLSSWLLLVPFIYLILFSKLDAFLLLWVIIPLCFISLSSYLIRPLFVPRYVIYVVPGLCLLLGFMADHLTRPLSWIFTSILVILMALSPIYPGYLDRVDFSAISPAPEAQTNTILLPIWTKYAVEASACHQYDHFSIKPHSESCYQQVYGFRRGKVQEYQGTLEDMPITPDTTLSRLKNVPFFLIGYNSSSRQNLRDYFSSQGNITMIEKANSHLAKDYWGNEHVEYIGLGHHALYLYRYEPNSDVRDKE